MRSKPHLFDIKISTKDGCFLDSPDNSYAAAGEGAEGFENLYGHSAHIGIETYQLPELVKYYTSDAIEECAIPLKCFGLRTLLQPIARYTRQTVCPVRLS